MLILDPLNEEAAARWTNATLYTQAQVDALVVAERNRCVRIAEAAKEDWNAYPEGGICDEIAACIRGGK